MIKKFAKERYSCGLDIGSQSVKAALIEIREQQKPALVGVYETPTSGYLDSSVTNLEDLTECIHAAVSGLSRKTKVKIREVQLGVGGGLLTTRSNHAAIPLVDRGHKVISNGDLRRLHAQAKLLGTQIDEIVLHHFPEFYKVDDVNMATHPVGLHGRKLELNSQLLVVKNTVIKNLTTAVHQAGYDFAQIFYNSYAASFAGLSHEQKQAGSILIDIGSFFSSILFFKAGRLVEVAHIPCGGRQITQNIARELSLTFDLAEDIKKSYGSLGLTDHQGDEDILIKQEEGYLPIKKRDIAHAINPVCEQIVSELIAAIKTAPSGDQMNRGIVLGGGGALLPGLPERVEREIHMPIQVGRIQMATRKLSYAPKFLAAVGLNQTAMASDPGMSAGVPPKGKHFSRLIHRIAELYQEYF